MKRFAPAVLVFLAALAVASPYLRAGSAPSADAELARWYRRNVSPLAWQAEWGGGSPAWMAGPPGLPLLAAAASTTGLPVEWAHAGVAVLLYALGALGVFWLSKSSGLPAVWTAVAFAVAPYRWSDLMRGDTASHAAAVAVLPFALLLFARWRLWAAAAGILLLGLFWLPVPARGNWFPEFELGLTLFAGWLARRTGRRMPVGACIVVFAAGLVWEAVFQHRLPSVTRSTLAWLDRHAPGESALTAVSPRPVLNPLRRQAEDYILSPWDPEFAALWLEAVGVSHLVSGRAEKFDTALETEHYGDNNYRVYQTPLRRSAWAVIVSRRQRQTLPAFSSFLDRAALAAYLNWANRPEPAGFRWTGQRRAEIRADLGPDDMILVRQNAGPGWTASIDGRPLECGIDPIGFLVLDPGRAGPVTILLSAPLFARRAIPAPLPDHFVPVIEAADVVGRVIVIYGQDIGGIGPTRVLVSGRAADVLHASRHQVNARLPEHLPPGRAEIVVEFGGGRSRPATVEINAP